MESKIKRIETYKNGRVKRHTCILCKRKRDALAMFAVGDAGNGRNHWKCADSCWVFQEKHLPCAQAIKEL